MGKNCVGLLDMLSFSLSLFNFISRDFMMNTLFSQTACRPKLDACLQFFHQLPDIAFIKNCRSEFIATNSCFAKAAGIKNPSSIEGLTDNDLPWSKYYQNYRDSDLDVISRGAIKILEQITINQIERSILCHKFPILNDDDEVIAIAGIIKILTEDCFLFKNEDAKIAFSYVCDQINNFSKRESECLYFLIRGFSAKSIAQKLNISYRTVQIYVDNIKTKMNCNKKSDLIEKAYANGYAACIPASIWRNQKCF